MVFRGRPSKACAQCRRRRIKCDQAVPACTQCIKIRVQCHGYRDQFELRIADETDHVRTKATTKGSGTGRTSPKDTASSNSDKSSASPSNPVFMIEPTSPVASVEDQARCYFLHNYTWADRQSATGHLSHVPDLLKKGKNEVVLFASTAIGLAALSNLHGNSELMAAGRRQYALALRKTNASLQDPVSARTNQTLTAVILLSIFEKLSFVPFSSMKGCTKHIEGATHLLKLRGADQFQEDVGLQLFRHFRFYAIMSCLCRNVGLPPDLENLLQLEVKYQPHSPASRLGLVAFQLCDLRTQMREGTITDSSTLLDQLLAIDARLAAWSADLPPSWDYQTIEDDAYMENGSYEHTSHIYSDYWHAFVWDHYRSVYIILNETLIQQLDRLDRLPPFTICHPAELKWYRARAQATITRLASDVCASVPFLLNRPSSRSSSSSSYNPTQPLPPVAAVSFLMWPLYVVGATQDRPAAQREWVVERLEFMGSHKGLPLAGLMGKLLKAKSVPTHNTLAFFKKLNERDESDDD